MIHPCPGPVLQWVVMHLLIVELDVCLRRSLCCASLHFVERGARQLDIMVDIDAALDRMEGTVNDVRA